MVRRGSGPIARLHGMWEALETLFGREDFNGSFPARAAIAVRTEPGQPVPAVYVKHHQAMRSMLEELVCEGQSVSAPRLAAQLELLVEGAIAGTAIDQEPSALKAARELSLIAMSLNGVRTTA